MVLDCVVAFQLVWGPHMGVQRGLKAILQLIKHMMTTGPQLGWGLVAQNCDITVQDGAAMGGGGMGGAVITLIGVHDLDWCPNSHSLVAPTSGAGGLIQPVVI